MKDVTTLEYKTLEHKENSYEAGELKLRDYQLFAKDILHWEVIDLLQDEDNYGHRLLSRADLILIYTLYNKTGIEGFYNEYMNYVRDKFQAFGETGVVQKPHIFLKNLIG